MNHLIVAVMEYFFLGFLTIANSICSFQIVPVTDVDHLPELSAEEEVEVAELQDHMPPADGYEDDVPMHVDVNTLKEKELLRSLLALKFESDADIEASREYPAIQFLFPHFFKQLSQLTPQLRLKLLTQAISYCEKFFAIDLKYNIPVFRLSTAIGLLAEPHVKESPFVDFPTYLIFRLSHPNQLPTSVDCSRMTPYSLQIFNTLISSADIAAYLAHRGMDPLEPYLKELRSVQEMFNAFTANRMLPSPLFYLVS
jgi:hypothetical protein